MAAQLSATKGRFAAAAELMDELRQHILAGAALALQQNRGDFALRDAAGEFQSLFHGRRRRHHFETARCHAIVGFAGSGAGSRRRRPRHLGASQTQPRRRQPRPDGRASARCSANRPRSPSRRNQQRHPPAMSSNGALGQARATAACAIFSPLALSTSGNTSSTCLPSAPPRQSTRSRLSAAGLKQRDALGSVQRNYALRRAPAAWRLSHSSRSFELQVLACLCRAISMLACSSAS